MADSPSSAADSFDITFIVPCFNEEKFICATFDSILQAMLDQSLRFEIIAVDDGSTDHTPIRIRDYKRTHPHLNLTLIQNEKNRGLGRNYLNTVDLARGTYYMSVNGDNDITPEAIRSLTAELGRYDMVIPFLYNQSQRPLYRQFISLLFTLFMRRVSGYEITYFNGPVLHRSANIRRWRSSTSGFAYAAELIVKGLNEGASYKEIGIHTVYHTQRSSAFRLKNLMSVLRSFFRVFSWRWRQS